ncbi:MAG: hypothetical protein JNL40_08675 [Cyclobacteriaceae bacterium]|nr:hypothetical protein [Cyclobacteriaceae bacterium]
MKRVIAIIISVMSLTSFAQDQSTVSKGDFGLGIGLDYGGFGGRVAFHPAPKVGLFGGLGYNLAGAGYNVGAAWRISPDKQTCPTLGVMYGYNGVIVVEGASQYNKIYYGPSLAAGLEFHSKRKNGNYFNVELVVPFRPQAFTDDLNTLKNNPAIQFKNEPWPVAISLGYHWAF